MIRKLALFLLTKEFRKHLLIAFVVVVAMIISVIFLLRNLTQHGESIPVPNFIGVSQSKIPQALSELFTFRVDSVYVEGPPPGTVTQQDPDPGVQVKRGRAIYLTVVSDIIPTVNMPDLEYKTLTEAQELLNSYGLRVGGMVYKPDIARDIILDVTYNGNKAKPGDALPQGASVELILGDGFGSVDIEVPDLIGQTLDEAVFSIRGHSLLPGIIQYEGVVDDTSRLKVIRQMPVASKKGEITKVHQGTKINLILSQ